MNVLLKKENKKMNRVMILIGPSGGGETTVANEIDKTLVFVRTTIYTTRTPRKGERRHCLSNIHRECDLNHYVGTLTE